MLALKVGFPSFKLEHLSYNFLSQILARMSTLLQGHSERNAVDSTQNIKKKSKIYANDTF